MGCKELSKKIMGLLLFIHIISLELRAVDEEMGMVIQESQNLIKELRVGLQPSQHVVITACVVNCKDAAREAQFLIKKAAADKVYTASLESVVIGPSELARLQLQGTSQENFIPIVVIEKKQSISGWCKFKWAAVGASVCAVACGIASWISFSFVAH